MKDKVVEFVVEPLNDWFGKPMNQGQASVYKEVLHGYSPDTLDKAVTRLKREWTRDRAPQPAIIREMCERVLPAKIFSTSNKETDFWFAAAKVMETRVGKAALSHGVARSMVCDFMEGKREFSDSDLDKYRASQLRANEAAKTLDPTDFLQKSTLNLWWTMQAKEQELIDKYKVI